jgi:hypothetical protein
MSIEEIIPEEFNFEEIQAGIAMERVVVVKSANPVYNKKAFRVRSLRGKEFRQIVHKINIKKGDVASNFDICLEACRLAILTPGVAERVDDLDHDVVLQIGSEILGASEPNEEMVEDFSPAE